MSIYQKILAAQKSIGYVAKNGKNTFHRYDYAMEADILDTVKTAVNEVGLILTTKTTSVIGHFTQKEDVIRWAKVTLHYSVIDAETGDTLDGTFDGYAEDKGDKAIYKATTGANKYFLMKFFGVATGDDPERDEQPAKPKAAPKNNTRPMPDRDWLDKDLKQLCATTLKNINETMRFEGWDAEYVKGAVGCNPWELAGYGTEEAALKLGSAYMRLQDHVKKGKRA